MKSYKKVALLILGVALLMFIFMDIKAAPSFSAEVVAKGKQWQTFPHLRLP